MAGDGMSAGEVQLLTYDEAVALLPDGERIHTFLDGGLAIIGAHWDRADILALLERTDRREVTGPAGQGQGLGHGLAAYRDGEPVFIETRPATELATRQASEGLQWDNLGHGGTA
jgi:hypothetical protein